MKQAKLDNYRSERGANAYKADHENKFHRKYSDRIERKILEKYFEELGPCERILDCPSGHGRFFDFLAERAKHVIEADVSQAMLALNEKDHEGRAESYIECSALEVPLEDRSVDVVVSIRLNHHFDKEADREAHLRELFRLADRGVVMTFFSFHSMKNFLRRVRRPLNRKAPKNTLRSSRVRAIADSCGFDTKSMTSLSLLSSGHIYVLFERRC